MELTIELIKYIASLLLGGGLVTIFTLPSLRRLKKSEADFSQIEKFQKSITAYNVMISDLENKVKDFVEKYNILENKSNNLSNKYNLLLEKYNSLQKDYRNLTRKYNTLKKKYEK